MDRRARIVLQADVSFNPPCPGELIHRLSIEHDGEMLADHGNFHFVPTLHSLWNGSGGLKTPDCAGRIAAFSTSVDLDFEPSLLATCGSLPNWGKRTKRPELEVGPSSEYSSRITKSRNGRLAYQYTPLALSFGARLVATPLFRRISVL